MKKNAFLIMVVLILIVALPSCGIWNNDKDSESTMSYEDLLDSISAALSDGSYGTTAPSNLPELQVKLYDDYAEITGCKNAIGKITIPDEFSGKPVTKIAQSAFEGMLNISSVYLPESIVEIGPRAFMSCAALLSIEIPDSTVKISTNAFYGSGLRSVSIGSGVSEIDTNAFGDCISLEEIKVSSANQTFVDEDGVLYSLDRSVLIKYPAGRKNENYIIFNTVKEVRNFAFSYSQYLKNVTVGNSVTSLGDHTFLSCTKLQNITLGQALTFIGANTFDTCTMLTSVTLPEGIKTIGYMSDGTEHGGSFYGCSSLTEINLPSTLTAIHLLSFDGCDNLKTVNFAGSSQEWAAISIGNKNEPLKSATVNH